jgi:hypothetical protein
MKDDIFPFHVLIVYVEVAFKLHSFLTVIVCDQH